MLSGSPKLLKSLKTLTQSLLNISIASTLCSRLVLNLYDVATPDGSTDSDSSPEPMTAGILTTRIELGIFTDYDDRSEVESTWK